MSVVRKSIIMTMVGNYVAMVLQFIAGIVLARLLTPAEVGIYSVAAVFTQLASVVRDFGVAEYLIQEKNLTRDKIRAAFTLNLGISWLMGLLLWFGREPLAAYYNEPGIAKVLTVTAWNFILIPFGAVVMAWFRREMNFFPLFLATVLGPPATIAITLTLAFHGHSYMSMAWGALVDVLITVTIALIFRPRDFPRLPGLRGLKEAFRFGTTASGIYIFGQVGKSAPDMVIGRAVDMAGVGHYSRAFGVLQILHVSVLGVVSRVALPYFAKADRESNAMHYAFMQASRNVLAVGWPFCVVVAILAGPIIDVLYGQKWLDSAPLLSLLAISLMIDLLFWNSKEAILATGNVKASAGLQIVTQCVRVACLLASAPFGLTAICASFLVSALINSAVSYVRLRRNIGLRRSDLPRLARSAALLTVGAALPALAGLIACELTDVPDLFILALCGTLSAIGWIGVLIRVRHPLVNEVRTLLDGVRKFVMRRQQ